MRTLLMVLAAAAVAHASLGTDLRLPDKCNGQICAKNYAYSDSCITAIGEQISRELEASITYLSAGAHFARDNVNRPGFSDLFFDHAAEERDHAFKLAEYLMMRGDDSSDYLQARYTPVNNVWVNGKEAFKAALKIEKAVTHYFTKMIKICENDWHAADWLTAEMLDEQHKSVRDFAGLIARLERATTTQPNLGEYLFDRELKQH